MRDVKFVGRVHGDDGEFLYRFQVFGRHFDGKAWMVVGMPLDTGDVPARDSAQWVRPEAVSWGGESIVTRLLPLVNADGEPAPFPGTVSVGRTPRGKLDHVWLYGPVSSVGAPGGMPSMCGRRISTGAAHDASAYVTDPYACKSCRKEVLARIAAL